MKNLNVAVLRNEVKNLTAQGMDLRQKINQSSGPARHALWLQKRYLGVTTRSVLIAYGLLRRMPYEVMERHCGENNRPSQYRISLVILKHCDAEIAGKWTKEYIETLLTRPVPSVHFDGTPVQPGECEECDGTGHDTIVACSECRGTGRKPISTEITATAVE